MKRLCILSLVCVLPACSSGGDDSTSPVTTPDASVDASLHDAASNTTDAMTENEAGHDAGAAASGDAGLDASDADAEIDASDGGESDSGCPSEWFVAPDVDPTIAVPDGGGHVILHAVGRGTQDYVCEATTPTDGAPTTYTWALVSPVATLSDCHDSVIGNHFREHARLRVPGVGDARRHLRHRPEEQRRGRVRRRSGRVAPLARGRRGR